MKGDGWLWVSKNGVYVGYGGFRNAHPGCAFVKLDQTCVKHALNVGHIRLLKRTPRHTRANGLQVRFGVRKKQHRSNVIVPLFEAYPMWTANKTSRLCQIEARAMPVRCFFTKIRSLTLQLCVDTDCGVFARSVVQKPSAYPTHWHYGVQLLTSYFDAWFVGFIKTKACFSICFANRARPGYKMASFKIGQNHAPCLITRIKALLGVHANVYQKHHFYKLKPASVHPIEKPVHWLHKTPVKLKGYKNLQCLSWLQNLKCAARYAKTVSITSAYPKPWQNRGQNRKIQIMI